MDKLNILSINAHPHDFTHMAATLGIHRERSDNVTVVSVTAGLNTHNEKLHDELMKPFNERDPEILNQDYKELEKIKKLELRKACSVFGISDVRVLDYPQPFRLAMYNDVIEDISSIILETRPHILIMQSPYSKGHHGRIGVSANDHIETARATLEAKEAAAIPGDNQKTPHTIPIIIYPGVYFNNDDIDFIVDISDWFEKRVEAEALYISQGHSPEWSRRRLLVSLGNTGWFSNTLYGEAFVREKPELVNAIPFSSLTLNRFEESVSAKYKRMIGKKGLDF